MSVTRFGKGARVGQGTAIHWFVSSCRPAMWLRRDLSFAFGLVRRTKCTTPPMLPSASPITRNSKTVPNWRSSQYPASPGSTISSDTMMMRDDHWKATATGDRSSEGIFTPVALNPPPSRSVPGRDTNRLVQTTYARPLRCVRRDRWPALRGGRPAIYPRFCCIVNGPGRQFVHFFTKSRPDSSPARQATCEY